LLNLSTVGDVYRVTTPCFLEAIIAPHISKIMKNAVIVFESGENLVPNGFCLKVKNYIGKLTFMDI